LSPLPFSRRATAGREKTSPQAVRRLRTAPRDGTGFDFTLHIRRLAQDISRRLPELSHVDLSQVAIRFCQARKAVPYGIQASLTPLRFENGALTTRRLGRTWSIQRVLDDSGREMLYLLSFYLPRFLELPWRGKLATVIHELWHISPEFNGDLRRHPGRCYAHSHSQRQYDLRVEQLVDRWLGLGPPEELHAFLKHNFRELDRLHGPIYGLTIPSPKLIRAAASNG
jgi:predicted metallopeptidase